VRYRPANMLDWVRGPIAQRLEQQTHNLLVPGSNPGGPTNRINHFQRNFLFTHNLKLRGRFVAELF
jgi:hypothetical protein